MKLYLDYHNPETAFRMFKAFWPSLVSYHKKHKLSGTMGYRNRYVTRYIGMVEQWYKNEAFSIVFNPET